MGQDGKKTSYTPVLGLMGDAALTSAPVQQAERPREPLLPVEATLELTVIIPARNEEASIGACLDSLVSQSESFFQLGKNWEILVVDDASNDKTKELAESKSGVTVLKTEPLASGWTGKNHAIWTAVKAARGRWLLFTDADTLHQPGNLRRAIHEATKYKAGLLSYSPRQLITGLAQTTVMPLIFCELALSYPPAKVSDPANKLAAANGQFMLFTREAYDRIGGHAAVAREILEDVALARLVKKRGLGLRFRYAPDALSTRMYRTNDQMVEGWCKNLNLLFANCRTLACVRMLDFLLLFCLPVLSWIYWRMPIAPLVNVPLLTAGVLVGLLWVRTIVRFYARVRKSNFPWGNCLLTPLGLPLFVYLLVRSWWLHHVKKQVAWKGRAYSGD
jgi:glycosyltransferase involved in cell wall biosynthesis